MPNKMPNVHDSIGILRTRARDFYTLGRVVLKMAIQQLIHKRCHQHQKAAPALLRSRRDSVRVYGEGQIDRPNVAQASEMKHGENTRNGHF